MRKATTSKERSAARQPMRRAGKVRFQKLLDAADSLLAEQHVQQIGLYQIAERATVPTASVYHFFPNKEAALLALAERHHEALQRIARAPLLPPPETWQDLVRRKVAGSADYHNEHPAALRLFLGAGVTVELKSADMTQTMRLAEIRAKVFSYYFDMPPVRDWVRRIATSIAIVDGVFALSYSQYGYLTPDFVDDAHRASIAYFRTFLPEQLDRRAQFEGVEPTL